MHRDSKIYRGDATLTTTKIAIIMTRIQRKIQQSKIAIFGAVAATRSILEGNRCILEGNWCGKGCTVEYLVREMLQ
jgi:hypothetical protein